jgi:hypothetical protein
MAQENKKPINWKLLDIASDFYKGLGYYYAEVPWMVSEEVANYTLPPRVSPFRTNAANNPILIGSAEQGFVSLLKDDLLADGKYYSISPCFRPENGQQLVPGYRQTEFMKLELFSTNPGDVPEMVANKLAFIKDKWRDYYGRVKTIATEAGFDIHINDIEVGSFGHRKIRTERGILRFAYGTGLALPRFDHARNLIPKGLPD